MNALLFLLLLAPLRDEVSLNPPQNQTTWIRDVQVPAAWQGKRIHLDFESVNFIADISVNNRQLKQHIGGFTPFTVDVTDHVKPGATFHLRVDVKGPKTPPIVDSNGGFTWPVGGWGSSNKAGIYGDVHLRAYGDVHIADAFIQTSTRKKEIAVDYTLRNTTARTRTVTLTATAGPKKLTPQTLTFQPNEARTVRLADPWSDAELWWPDRPHLYNLRTELRESNKLIDAETRRFGFREIWIDGTQFQLNGVRANLFGDYQVYNDTWYTTPDLYTRENWPRTVDQILAMNIRVLRIHHEPPPNYILDIADEKGLLICAESANYARDYHKKSNQAEYLKNAATHIAAWIKAQRNHPSIYMWNATNEMTHSFAGSFKPDELKKLGDLIRTLDPTRPVGYDGDRTVEGELIDYHYPEGYNNEPRGSIYSWSRYLDPSRPTGAGEMLHTRSPIPEVQPAMERNTHWLGLWLRGLRYTNWTNVKPALWWFAWKDGFKGPRTERLRNALNPIALFDREYDDLGIAPPPVELPAGRRTQRTLVLYNDDFRGTDVEALVTVRANGKDLTTASTRHSVPNGEHILITCDLTPPSGPFELILRTRKDGRQRFEETRAFLGAGTTSTPPTLALNQQAPEHRIDLPGSPELGPWTAGSKSPRWTHSTDLPVTDGIFTGRYMTHGLYPKQAVARIEFIGSGKTLSTRTYGLAASNAPFWGAFDIPIFRAPAGADRIRVSVGLNEKTNGRVQFADLRVTRYRYTRGFRETEPLTRPKPPAAPLSPSPRARVGKDKNTWWLIAPDGKPFFSLGTLPGTPKTTPEAAQVLSEMERMGFNSLAGSHSVSRFAPANAERANPMWQFRTIEVHTDKPYGFLTNAQGLLPGSQPAAAKARGGFNHGFPDPYDPAFEADVRTQVQTYLKDLGTGRSFVAWFAGNEREHKEMHRYVYGAHASKALVEFLRRKYATVEGLNRAWTTTYPTFEAILENKPDPEAREGSTYEDFRAFSRDTLRRYNDTYLRVIRELDPGRLVISNRFMVGEQRDVLDNLDCYTGFDIIAVNIYPSNTQAGLAPDERAFLQAVHTRTQKPVLIGEWSVPALDSGLYDNTARLDWSYPQTVETQTERARQSAQILADFYNMPFVVGAHWFTWSDIDNANRQANRGLYKANGETWTELQSALQSAHKAITMR